ncbi:hypothetical protein KAW50_00525 [candidate division WOR-3 bacterium]|nr:hypothetical protein [candidate division WOR-3 bacterium]
MIFFFVMLLEPIITPGSPGSWNDAWVLDGHVIVVNDTLKMWYLGKKEYTGVYNYMGIGYAYSVDTGKTWQEYSGNPVFITDSNSQWEHSSTGYDGLWEAVVIYEDGEYKMWYQSQDYCNCWNTLYARSDDGINWERGNQGKPVIYASYHEGGGFPRWDSWYAGARAVIRRNSLYYIFYEGGSFSAMGNLSLGLAIGTSETVFTKVDTNAPVFTTVGTLDTMWAGESIIPNVILNDGTFILIYSPNITLAPPATVGLALSKDGIDWERYDRNPFCDFHRMGIPGGQVTSVYWDITPGLKKELIAILRRIPAGIFSCRMPVLLLRP